MSKYRIVIAPSRIRQAFVALFTLLCIVPVWLVTSDVYSVSWFFQCLLCLSLVVLAWQQIKERQVEKVVSIEDNGAWIPLNESDVNIWQVAAGSRVSTFLLWIELTPRSLSKKTKSQWLWVFRDSVNQQDFRRLSRIIIRSQRIAKEVSHYG